MDVFPKVSTPDLSHDVHCGAAVHTCAAEGMAKAGDKTKTTVIGKEPEAIEAGAPIFKLILPFEPLAGDAGPPIVVTKNAGDICAGDITISVKNGVVEVSFGHRKTNLTAHRGSHLTDSVKPNDPCEVSEKSESNDLVS